jgi:hypothetical protein
MAASAGIITGLHARLRRTASELDMTPLPGPPSPLSVTGNHPAILVKTSRGLTIPRRRAAAVGQRRPAADLVPGHRHVPPPRPGPPGGAVTAGAHRTASPHRPALAWAPGSSPSEPALGPAHRGPDRAARPDLVPAERLPGRLARPLPGSHRLQKRARPPERHRPHAARCAAVPAAANTAPAVCPRARQQRQTRRPRQAPHRQQHLRRRAHRRLRHRQENRRPDRRPRRHQRGHLIRMSTPPTP